MARQPYTHTDPTPPQCPQNCHCGAPDHLPKPPCGLGGDMPQGSPTDLEVFPLLQPSFTQGFPPAFLQVCGLNLLPDDRLLYTENLREARESTKLY